MIVTIFTHATPLPAQKKEDDQKSNSTGRRQCVCAGHLHSDSPVPPIIIGRQTYQYPQENPQCTYSLIVRGAGAAAKSWAATAPIIKMRLILLPIVIAYFYLSRIKIYRAVSIIHHSIRKIKIAVCAVNFC